MASAHIKVPGEDHSANTVYHDPQTVWGFGQLIAGTGMKIVIFAYEEDEGKPEAVTAKVKQYLEEKAKQGANAIGQAYNAGTEATAIANSEEAQWVLNVLSVGLASLLADDEVGYQVAPIGIAEIERLSAMSLEQYQASLLTGPKNMKYTHKLDVYGSDEDGVYRVYFRVAVSPRQAPIVLPPIPRP